MQNEINMASIIDNARVTAESSLASKPRGDQSLREVAEQFEAIFLNEFIKQAERRSLPTTFWAATRRIPIRK